MKHFKMMVVLFAFLFISVCNNGCSAHTIEMLSSQNINIYKQTDIMNNNQEVLKANVMIFNSNYSSFLGFKYKENNSYGSGVIYKSDEQYYYVLTNNHVISYDYGCNYHELEVEDYYSNKYTGYVVYSDNKYDLAVIRFEKKVELLELSISKDRLDVRESVRSMGNPSSVKNVLNKGMVNCYSYLTLENDKSNISFEVIVHSALISRGSSGGAILNNKNEIAGITFAGVFDNNGNFIAGYAISAEKILEFLYN